MVAFATERVLDVRHWNESLFSFRTTRDASLRFENGHFVMLGLPVDGKPLLRAYSIASANYEDHLEFFSIKVANGPLTSRLQHLKPGDDIIISRKPVGTLLLHDLLPGTRHEGRLRVAGEDVYAPGLDVVAHRQRVGMVFQRPNPFPKSIFDNVAYGPRLNRLAADRDLPEVVERCLRLAALWDEVKDRLEQPATGLSGGQQQRLCIARALGNQPEVLLMDEPCSALDPIATQRVEELIFELKRDYTIVIVTHNMQQAARVSSRTAFFDLDRLVEYDETGRLFTNPAHERTEAYITGRFG